MRKKRILLYGMIVGAGAALATGVYVYQEYLGEDSVLSPEEQAHPIINEKLRAVVIRKSVQRVGNANKLVLHYADLTTHTTNVLTVDAYPGQTIQTGDTLTKDKGERIMLIYHSDGKIDTVPVE